MNKLLNNSITNTDLLYFSSYSNINENESDNKNTNHPCIWVDIIIMQIKGNFRNWQTIIIIKHDLHFI